MPPKKRQKRIYENARLTREAAGFDTAASYNHWRQSEAAKLFWDIFENGYLNTDMYKQGKKGDEFEHVYNHVMAGENGRGRFSKDASGTTLENGLDWSAWLLCHLVRFNREYTVGCLHGLSLCKADYHRVMWNLIKNELRTRNRTKKMATQIKAPRTSISATPSKRVSTPDDSSSSDDDEELDPNVGIAKVNWEMSMALEAVVARENIQVSRFCSYTETQFRKHLIQVFDFERHNQVIDELSTRGGFSFDETQRRAAQSERVYFTLTSRDAVIVEETISAPSAAISAPNGFQEADDVSNRRLAWTAMVEYAKYTNANRLDLSVPLWKYQFLRSMGRGCNEFEVENVILRFDGQFDEHLALQYTHDLSELNRELSSRDSSSDDKTEDYDGIPLSRYKEITQQQIEQYREQAVWVDNKDYQRADHIGACKYLGIENPDLPHIKGLFLSRKFNFYQPTAIKAIVDFENSPVHGGVLAEDVGLGKTVEVIGLLLFRLNERKRLISNNQEVPPALPTLIILPPSLVMQWTAEIKQFTDEFDIVVYWGAAKRTLADNVVHFKGKLTRSSEFFNGDEKNSICIILSTYNTWGIRHGLNALKKEAVAQRKAFLNCTQKAAVAYVEAYYEQHSRYPRVDVDLRNLFVRVILDEAHEMRNLSKQIATSILWLQPQYRIALTGTPTLSGIIDFAGIMAFIQPNNIYDIESLKEMGLTVTGTTPKDVIEEVFDQVDPWNVDDEDPTAILKFTPEALRKHVFNKNKSQEEQGKRMRTVFSQIVLRRSFASTIDGQRIGDQLPAVQRTNIACEYTPLEREHYNFMCNDQSTVLFRKRSNADGNEAVVWNTTTYRKLCLITSWLGLGYLLNYKAAQLKKFRKGNGSALDLLKDLCKGQARQGVPQKQRIPLVADMNVTQVLEHHCTGSPKLRQLLKIIADLVVFQDEKITVWCNNPLQMQWLESVLKACNLEAEQLRTDLTMHERDDLITRFQTDPESAKILICSYMVSCAGLNMHYLCRTIVEFEPAPCEGVRQQTIGRVRRKGQQKWCRHICLTTKDSFNTKQTTVSLLKSLPALITQLNLEVFGGSAADDEDQERLLGDYVRFENDIYPVDDPIVAGKNLEVLSADTLLLYIQLKMSGEPLQDDYVTMYKVLQPKKPDSDSQPVSGPLWI